MSNTKTGTGLTSSFPIRSTTLPFWLTMSNFLLPVPLPERDKQGLLESSGTFGLWKSFRLIPDSYLDKIITSKALKSHKMRYEKSKISVKRPSIGFRNKYVNLTYIYDSY